MRLNPGDPELLSANHPEGELGPLFGDWPEAPAPDVEQGVMPLEVTITGKYARWRRTEDGARVFESVRIRALGLARTGQRIGVKQLVEDVRSHLKMKVNNSFSALIARELCQDPSLVSHIERRTRTAS